MQRFTKAAGPLACAAATVVLVGAAALPAHAAQDVIEVSKRWDGEVDDIRHIPLTLLGDGNLAVPGDSGSATLRVRNDGPTDGWLTAQIIDVVLHDRENPDDVYQHLLVNGMPAAEVAATHPILTQERVRRGAATDLPFTWEMPVVDSGNAAQHGPREVSFVVRLHTSGQMPSAADLRRPPTGPGRDWGGVVAETGGTLLGQPSWAWAVAALAGAALAGRLLARRSRESPAAPGTTEPTAPGATEPA